MGNDSSLCCLNREAELFQDKLQFFVDRDDNEIENYQITFEKTNITYQGQLQNGIPHGKGIQIHPQGDVYQGEFYQGTKQGTGTYTFSSGDTYQGNFIKNRMNGNGCMLFSNGDSYQGQFKNNLMHGYGIYKSKCSKSQYQGNYINGEKHGQGVLKSNGSIYRGKWDHGVYCSY